MADVTDRPTPFQFRGKVFVSQWTEKMGHEFSDSDSLSLHEEIGIRPAN